MSCPLLLCSWAFWIRLLDICFHDGCAFCLGHTVSCKEGRLYQVVAVLLRLAKAEVIIKNLNVCQGIDRLLLQILALWVQQWEIDSAAKKTPKVLGIQYHNFLNVHISTCFITHLDCKNIFSRGYMTYFQAALFCPHALTASTETTTLLSVPAVMLRAQHMAMPSQHISWRVEKRRH